ncbi:uncharacterized protein LOC129225041 [Uloborus diversus]|uniref:uncharacterized protein LOC129225041 n=1 Tax=Uloborus diversus TaxID=327109 RepID=UPI00240987D6|nr:uncharacterized protein LOC129225041 [Uloborus diversus]
MCPHREAGGHIVLGEDKIENKREILRERRQRRRWSLSKSKSEESLLSATKRLERQSLGDVTNIATALTVEDKGNSQSLIANGDSSWSAKQIPRTKPIRRPDNLRSEGNADFTTIHQQDFQTKSSKIQLIHPASESNAREATEQSWNRRQVSKTRKIVKKDNLTLSGPLNLETTNNAVFNENVFRKKSEEELDNSEPFNRPRTSLKLSGEFQSDSSYQQAFTPKRASDNFKVKKGTSRSHLKPEGEMIFDTTSLDYKATASNIHSEDLVALKPKNARPQSEIKIPTGPISDETTAVNDFKRWKVGKPLRHKPSDTFQLNDGSETNGFRTESMAFADLDGSQMRHLSERIAQKPKDNLISEGDFTFETTQDTDYSPSKLAQQSSEALSDHQEVKAAEIRTFENGFAGERNEAVETTEAHGTENTTDYKSAEAASVEAKSFQDQEFAGRNENHVETITNGRLKDQTVQESMPVEEYMHGYEENEEHYLTWDEIRPKPIRPHSNLRQEGEMQFNTTNRSEFVERSSERVKGIRPKTTTKVFEGDFDATTMNQIMFSSEQAEKAIPIRPRSNLHVEKGDFVDETTTAKEFQQWEINRPAPIVPKSSLTQEGLIDFTTTNKTEFEEKHPEKVYPIRPTTTNKISGDLNLTTTSREMHAEYPIERVQKIVPQPNLRMSSGAIDFETTSKAQFQDWNADRPKPIRPVPNLRQEGSIDFTTMNQMQFDRKPMEKLQQFRPKTSSKITGDFDGTTTNQVMFETQAYKRPEMIKPRNNLEVERGKFSSDTTNQVEFQAWKRAKPEAITPRSQLNHQEGEMDFTTTNQLQYAAKSVNRVSEIRPKSDPKITGSFDDTTINRLMFQNIPTERPRQIRPKTNLKLEQGSFNNETINQTEFQTWDYSRPSPIKPRSSLRQEGDLDFTTMNKMQFEGKMGERMPQVRPTTATRIVGEGDFDATTTNQIMFPNKTVEKVRGKRPSTNLHLEKGKFNGETTARREFQHWNTNRPDAIVPTSNLTQEGSMDFTTLNQIDFEEKPMTKVDKIVPHASSPVTGDFDGTTTNQIMYQTVPIEKVRDIRPRDNLRIQSGEFSSETTNLKDFGYKPSNKPEPIKHQPSLAQQGDFDFITSNQIEFEEKPLDRPKRMRQRTLTQTLDGQFHSTSTNQEMFEAQTMEKTSEIRPSNNIQMNEGLFQGTTTTSDEYRQWVAEKPKAYQLVTSLKHEGDMNFETTNRSEFGEKSFDKVQQIRPKTTNKTEGKFTATTTNQAMFQQHEKLERVKPIRHENNLHVEAGKFSNETTSNREYKQWVRMENTQVRRKKLNAAGIQTQGKDSNGIDENQKAENAEDHQLWKLKALSLEAGEDTSQPTNEKQKAEDSTLQQSVVLHPDDENSKQDVEGSNQHIEAESQNEIAHSTEVTQKTTYRDVSTVMADYGGKLAPRVKAIRPDVNLKPGGSMSFATTSKTDFTQADIAAASVDMQSAVQNGVSERSDVQDIMNGETVKESSGETEGHVALNEAQGTISQSSESQDIYQTASQSSQHLRTRAPKRYKPDDNLKIDLVPFEGASTTKSEYKKWEARRSSSKRRGESLKQEGEMEFETTSHDYSVNKDYFSNRREMQLSKAQEAQKSSLAENGGMEFSTTANTSYTGNAGSRSKNLRPRSSFKLGGYEPRETPTNTSRSNPETGADHTSTSRASYVGHTTNRPSRAQRPTTSQKVGQGHFEGQTTTRSSFKIPVEQVEKTKTIKPQNHNILATENGFTGDTTYRKSFETKGDCHCPVIDLQTGRSGLAFNEERNGHIFYAPKVHG